MKNIVSCISCMNCKINKLENQVTCIINLLNNMSNSNLLIGDTIPEKKIGENNNLYIQLKGGTFYKKINNNWNIIGTIEPLIIDGGDHNINKLKEE